jgi:hypothetical protein
MKRKICVLLIMLFFCSVVYSAETVTVSENIKDYVDSLKTSPVVLTTNQNEWIVLDTTTMADSEPNDPCAATGEAGGYGGRTLSAVLADTNSGALEISVVYLNNPTWNGALFQLVGITDGNTVTYQIYTGTLPVGVGGTIIAGSNCALHHKGQLAWTVGGQVSDISGYNFADALTVTTSALSTGTASWNVTNPGAGTDRVAQGKVDLEGANVIVCVPVIVNCDCKLLGKGC